MRTVFELDNLCAKIASMSSVACREAAFLAGEGGWQQSESTHDSVIGGFLDPAGWTSDRLYCHTFGATTNSVFNAFNSGRSVGCFTGLGSVDAWLDGPSFTKADVLALSNTVYPFVMSFACLTGDYSSPECFGETWVRSPHGASAFFGASSFPFSGSTVYLETYIFEGWLGGGRDRIGEMIVFAVYMIEATGLLNPSEKLGLFEMYNLLGDPAMTVTGASPLPPVPDIKVNGDDGPLSFPSTQAACISISLDPGGLAGVSHDWWIGAVRNGSTLFCWTPSSAWTFCTTPIRAYAGPLVGLSELTISHGRIPPGSWTIAFAVDDLNNAFEGTWRDTVTVTSL